MTSGATVPYFKNAVVDIEHTAARPSWFEIPVAKTIQPSLTSATLNIDTKVPADVVFHVEGTPGAEYLLAFGISGISPGIVLPGGATALLNVDGVTNGLLAIDQRTIPAQYARQVEHGGKRRPPAADRAQ